MRRPAVLGAAAVKRALSVGALRAPSLRLAAARRRRLVLVYHRIGPDGPSPHEVVPTVPVALLREHLEALSTIGDIVDLVEVLDISSADGPRSRPKLALTFDDDYRCHVEYTLPILLERELTATFFLSGRSLAGLGPYWWERLECLISAKGIDAVKRQLGVEADSLSALAAACEGTPLTAHLEQLDAGGAPEPLTETEIKQLAESGMRIGFHTLHHPLLTALGPEAISRHLTDGRDALERTIAEPFRFFAYPHGRATRVIADQVRSAGFAAAFTGTGRALGRTSHRYLASRWEPGLATPRQLVGEVLMRLAFLGDGP